MSAAASQRRLLPQRRAATSLSLHFGSVDYVVTLGHFEDGSPAEVFIDGAKAGSDIQAMSRDAAILISLALQFGCPIETLRRAITRNSDGTPQSIVGAVLDTMCKITAGF
jgi:hypothetical protein